MNQGCPGEIRTFGYSTCVWAESLTENLAPLQGWVARKGSYESIPLVGLFGGRASSGRLEPQHPFFRFELLDPALEARLPSNP